MYSSYKNLTACSGAVWLYLHSHRLLNKMHSCNFTIKWKRPTFWQNGINTKLGCEWCLNSKDFNMSSPKNNEDCHKKAGDGWVFITTSCRLFYFIDIFLKLIKCSLQSYIQCSSFILFLILLPHLWSDNWWWFQKRWFYSKIIKSVVRPFELSMEVNSVPIWWSSN